jgi:hypothetical protein
LEILRVALYALAVLTSAACTVLLIRGWRRNRYRMLMWSAVCFAWLTVNNLLLFADLVLFPASDLRVVRLLAALAGIACMLYAFIWETD